MDMDTPPEKSGSAVADPPTCNEMYGAVRSHYRAYARWLEDKPLDYMLQKQRETDALYTRPGITFAVYGDGSGVERSIPFDIIPRILRADAWRTIYDGG